MRLVEISTVMLQSRVYVAVPENFADRQIVFGMVIFARCPESCVFWGSSIVSKLGMQNQGLARRPETGFLGKVKRTSGVIHRVFVAGCAVRFADAGKGARFTLIALVGLALASTPTARFSASATS